MRHTQRAHQPIHTSTSGLFCGLVAASVFIGALGCIEGGPGAGGFSNVSGSIRGEDFQMFGGVAERNGSGYAVTITDSSSYGCVSTPSSRYLQVTWGVDAEGTSDAVGNVTFSSVETNISPSEPATSGAVTIDAIDETNGFISGSISAQARTSEIDGTFEVEICP